MRKFFTCVVLLIAFLALVVKADTEDVQCDDALKEDNQLCKRFKEDGHCKKRSVQDFCQKSCNLCRDEGFEDSYMGCYHDGIVSEMKLMNSPNRVTIRSCIDSCRKRDYEYAALRNGMYCLCGDSYGSHGEVKKRNGCSKRCGSKESCGDYLENAIYKTEQVAKKEYKREYLENIQAFVLGEEKKQIVTSQRREEKKLKLEIPKNRGWNFMDFIRRFEDQRHQ